MRELHVRIPESLYEKCKYWAEKHECYANEYIAGAIELRIKHENGDYDLPTAEQQRLAQILERLMSLEASTDALEKVVVNGLDSLLSLTRGQNYLLEDEDGEID